MFYHDIYTKKLQKYKIQKYKRRTLWYWLKLCLPWQESAHCKIVWMITKHTGLLKNTNCQTTIKRKKWWVETGFKTISQVNFNKIQTVYTGHNIKERNSDSHTLHIHVSTCIYTIFEKQLLRFNSTLNSMSIFNSKTRRHIKFARIKLHLRGDNFNHFTSKTYLEV